jgi:hypothetical protein
LLMTKLEKLAKKFIHVRCKAEMGIEAKGIILGPLNVSGMVYKAYFDYSNTEDKQ